jgi:hypothetical protein
MHPFQRSLFARARVFPSKLQFQVLQCGLTDRPRYSPKAKAWLNRRDMLSIVRGRAFTIRRFCLEYIRVHDHPVRAACPLSLPLPPFVLAVRSYPACPASPSTRLHRELLHSAHAIRDYAGAISGCLVVELALGQHQCAHFIQLHTTALAHGIAAHPDRFHKGLPWIQIVNGNKN